ncbi:MAG: ABC-F family ATP-binding cassette domain-containing protein, partial [Trueperaceae bacterium]|nr:ABC-F family ATP-binding cassette domain-containing protein [Trueperaceae bacterium]
MELLRAGAVAVGAAGAELVAGLDLRLATGDRLGLVGPNGSGKSTLLRVLAGVAAPLDGRVARPPGVRVGLLPQSVAALPGRTVTEVLRAATLRARELEARLRESETRLAFGGTADDAVEHAALAAEFDRAGGYGAEAAAREVAAALGFRAGGRDLTCAELSPGERRRLQLAVTLAAAPDVLLLDEPTNHLDLTAREWLTRRLGAYAGAVVVVSHDRALLDAATTRTLFLAEGRAWHEPGPYSLARRRRDAAVGAGHKRARELERDARRLERMAVELAAFGRKAAARRRRAERDGRALRVEARVAAPAERVAPPQLAPRQAPSTRLRAAGGETLVTVRHLAAEGLLSDVGLELRRGERVVLVGPNGSGKSTVLRAVAGDLTGLGPRAELDYLPGVKLRVVDQLDRGLTPGVPLLEQVAAAVGEAAGRRLLADAGVPARTWELTPEQVSGGERIRAGLALAFAHPADLWLLDEPTNDLDLAAVEALETQLTAMLAGGSAALLLVTHDRRLAERVADEAWSVVDGSLLRYRDVGAYLRGEHEPDAPVPPAVATTTVATTAVAWADPPGVAETHPPAAAAAVARRPRPGWSDPALL